MTKPDPSLSLCMIVKNESTQIADCLAEASPYCFEMLVVDTGSTDDTKDLARRAGATVFDFAGEFDFSKARNLSLLKASGDWILVLDADERLTSQDWQNLKQAIREGQSDCLDLEQINYSFELAVAGSRPNTFGARGFTDYPVYTSSWLTRAFKNGCGYAFSGVVHEHLSQNGLIVDGPRVSVQLHHHGQALKPQLMAHKKNLYLKLGRRKAELEPHVAKNWHELGVAEYETGDLAAAQKSLEQALSLAPDNENTRLVLGTVLQHRGFLDKALVQFNAILAKSPKHPVVHSALGCCHFKKGDAARAIRSFSRQIQINPDFLQARFWLYDAYNILRRAEPHLKPSLSVCLITKNEEAFIARLLKNVGPHVDEIIVADTGSTDKTREIARDNGARVFEIGWRDDFSWARNQSLMRATGEWILVLDADEQLSALDWAALHELIQKPEAELFELIQTNYSDGAAAMNWKVNDLNVPESEGFPGYIESRLVRLFRNTPQIAFMGAVHEHAVSQDPKFKKEKTSIRIHHDGKFRDEKSRQLKNELYERLGRKKINEMPKNPQSYHEFAIQLLESGKGKDAEKYFCKALEVAPNMREALFGYASFLLGEGRYKESLALYERYVTLYPGDSQGFIYMASVLIELKKFDAAWSCLEHARGQDSQHAVSLTMNEGVVLLNLNRLDEAETKFNEALKLSPNTSVLFLNLALVAIMRGDYEAARLQLEKTIKFDPKNHYAHKKMGEILFNCGEREKSLEYFIKSAELNPVSTDILSLVIICAHSLGKISVVREYENQLLSCQPHNEEQVHAIKRILGVYAKRSDQDGMTRLMAHVLPQDEVSHG